VTVSDYVLALESRHVTTKPVRLVCVVDVAYLLLPPRGKVFESLYDLVSQHPFMWPEVYDM